MSRRLEIPQAQVPVPGARGRFRHGMLDIALFHVGDQLHAIDDSCPHQGASLLAGVLEGRLVKCRAHGLRFDLATGQMPGAPGFGVRAYAIEREGERLYLVLPEEPETEATP